MTKHFAIIGDVAPFFIESSDGERFGPYAHRTNANRRLRALRAAEVEALKTWLLETPPVKAPEGVGGDQGAPEPEGVGIDSPHAYERHEARTRYALAQPMPRRTVAGLAAELGQMGRLGQMGATLPRAGDAFKAFGRALSKYRPAASVGVYPAVSKHRYAR